MIADIFQSGSMPVLQKLVQFTEARQKLLAHDVANLTTPYFKPMDVDPKAFQKQLGEAIDRRRQSGNPSAGPLDVRDSNQVQFDEQGGLTLRPTATNQGILFHDQNNRDLERIMQGVAENQMAHRVALDLLASRYGQLATAISERV
ncbi:MAG: hypothetical protein IT442_10895 [Phycisphaeraceae bacterium]|nr:hypothetical protein [Phycisphaeraceae bacterium]